MTILYLVRHAQSHPSVKVPHDQWPLTDRGKLQAKQLVPVLNTLDIGAAFCSPFLRCRDTIGPFIEEQNIPLTIEEALRERLVSEGLIPNFMEVLDRSWRDFSFALPNCESSADCQLRMLRIVEKIATENAHRTVLICSHGHAISLLIHGLDSEFGKKQWLGLRNPELLRLKFEKQQLQWDKSFAAPEAFNQLATDVHDTPVDAPWKK